MTDCGPGFCVLSLAEASYNNTNVGTSTMLTQHVATRMCARTRIHPPPPVHPQPVHAPAMISAAILGSSNNLNDSKLNVLPFWPESEKKPSKPECCGCCKSRKADIQNCFLPGTRSGQVFNVFINPELMELSLLVADPRTLHTVAKWRHSWRKVRTMLRPAPKCLATDPARF